MTCTQQFVIYNVENKEPTQLFDQMKSFTCSFLVLLLLFSATAAVADIVLQLKATVAISYASAGDTITIGEVFEMKTLMQSCFANSSATLYLTSLSMNGTDRYTGNPLLSIGFQVFLPNVLASNSEFEIKILITSTSSCRYHLEKFASLENVTLYDLEYASVETFPNDELNFLVLGDWGSGGNDGDITGQAQKTQFRGSLDMSLLAGGKNKYTYQAAIAKEMAALASKSFVSFVVALGDNFYNDGVQSTTDNLWKSYWSQVYFDRYAVLYIPWFAILGNHDYGMGYQGVRAQIQKTKVDPLWNMPAQNYVESFPLNDGGVLTIVFVDTTTLAPSLNKCCNEKGGVSTSEQQKVIKAQLEIIENLLIQATKLNGQPSWLVVSGHYPIVSKGEHGDSAELLSNLQPLLEKYSVDAYLCGHDHIGHHIQYNGIEYFVSGGGAFTNNVINSASIGTMLWAGTGYSSVALASVTTETFKISYYDIYDSLKYSYSIVKDRTIGSASNYQNFTLPSDSKENLNLSNSSDSLTDEVTTLKGGKEMFVSTWSWLISSLAFFAFLCVIFVNRSKLRPPNQGKSCEDC